MLTTHGTTVKLVQTRTTETICTSINTQSFYGNLCKIPNAPVMKDSIKYFRSLPPATESKVFSVKNFLHTLLSSLAFGAYQYITNSKHTVIFKNEDGPKTVNVNSSMTNLSSKLFYTLCRGRRGALNIRQELETPLFFVNDYSAISWDKTACLR